MNGYLNWHFLQPGAIMVPGKGSKWEKFQLLPPTAECSLSVTPTDRCRSSLHRFNSWWRSRVWTWCSRRFLHRRTLCLGHRGFSIWHSICWHLEKNISRCTGPCLSLLPAPKKYRIVIDDTVLWIIFGKIPGIFIDNTILRRASHRMSLASLFWRSSRIHATASVNHTLLWMNFECSVMALERRSWSRLFAAFWFCSHWSSHLHLHNICWCPSFTSAYANTITTANITGGWQFNVLWFGHLFTFSTMPSPVLPLWDWLATHLCESRGLDSHNIR